MSVCQTRPSSYDPFDGFNSSGSVTLDLGGSAYNLASVDICHGDSDFGIGWVVPGGASVYFSTDGETTFSPTANTTHGAFNSGDPTGQSTITTIPLAGTGVTDVRIDFTAPGHFSLGEITFDGGPIPEPATMSLLALGGLGVLMRRRKK